ncbi:MAG TPA: sigma-54 dependent transcriptional regulator [Pyrinomonadaceae bacterium]
MRNMTENNRVEEQSTTSARDTIHIMRGIFEPELLSDAVSTLQSAGYRCVIFDEEALRDAFRDAQTGLVLLSATCAELPRLLEALRTCKRNESNDIPVLLYYRQQSDRIEEVLLPEIDDFILAPMNLNDLLMRAQRLLRLVVNSQNEVEQVKLSLMSRFGMRQFIGNAPAFLREVEKIPRVAACDATVLLIGETGTGKEMCARAIHYLSPRANKPFVPVNCGSVPPELFESEMFGHEAGAFTDAKQARRGLIAEAEGGTLFLDEVDSLPLPAQVKLLRFLQDRQYRPLGATGFRQSDTRLIVASNQNLLQKVREGKFREDLYYRLRVVSLPLPSLRERREDIVSLATHFLKTSAHEYRSPAARLSHDAAQKLMSYSWPGNVRELENIIRQSVVLATGAVVRAHDVHLTTDTPRPAAPVREPFNQAKARMIESFERDYLTEMLHHCDSNISRAARTAQKDRRAFFALLKKYGLSNSKREFDNSPEEKSVAATC